MWGQVYADMVRGIYNGIIPTRVGTSVLVRWQYEATKDHPHACGDKLSDEFVLLNDLGSSPRVWGQVTRYLHMLKDSGIIPTRVGTSRRPSV